MPSQIFHFVGVFASCCKKPQHNKRLKSSYEEEPDTLTLLHSSFQFPVCYLILYSVYVSLCKCKAWVRGGRDIFLILKVFWFLLTCDAWKMIWDEPSVFR